MEKVVKKSEKLPKIQFFIENSVVSTYFKKLNGLHARSLVYSHALRSKLFLCYQKNIIEGPDQRMGRALENAEKYRPRCDVTRESSKSENKKNKKHREIGLS